MTEKYTDGGIKMLKIERQKIIEQEVHKQGFVLVPSMSELLRCSEETVRRDLKELEKSGRLVRTHGGAYLIEQYDKSYPTDLRKSYMHKTKERMAHVAMGHIHENDVIMLDSSTTCLALAESIVQSKMSLTVITNSLPICDLCNDSNTNINLVCIGGTFRRRTSSFTDYHTVDVLSSFHADRAFISCPKVTTEFGLSDNHLSESRVRECMIKHAETSSLILDHTKFEGTANILFGGFECIKAIITDRRLSAEWEEYTRSHGIAVEYAME